MGLCKFDNKKMIVFGASSGIGKQTAIQLSQLGAKLVLVSRNEACLQETASRLQGENHFILPCDVSDFDAAQNVVKEAVSRDKIKLDGCVFSVGSYTMYPVSAAKMQPMQEMFQTNFFSFVAILRAFSSRRISNDGASFVSISSRAAMIPDKAQGIYGATKAAINAYTVAAAKELSARMIRVNAVCPEAVDTPMGSGIKAMPPEQLQRTYPLGLLTAEDVANTVIYLLSSYSTKVTGQSIWLSAGNDGGSVEGHIL